MAHELEQFDTEAGQLVTAFAFTGSRDDIWHRLGQSIEGREMTAEEAMRESHMNRLIRIIPLTVGDVSHWSIPKQYAVVLEGDVFVEANGDLVTVPDKVVGIHGHGGADAHGNFSVRDRFLLAEEAIHASHGEAVWSTAGSLRDGTQAFATMKAPDVIIDPCGINDIINQYLTLTWSYDGTRSTELGSSEVRTKCANTLATHDMLKQVVIRVKHTSHTASERFTLAAEQWANAQNRAAALKLQAERLLAVEGKQRCLSKIIEKFDPVREDASKRETSLRKTRLDLLAKVSAMPTNDVGDNGWAAWNTWVEYLDYFAPIKCGKDETEADRRMANQFDGTYDVAKANAAELILETA